MEFEFELEDAVHELEQINDLLNIYNEFVRNECPEAEARGEDVKLAAQIFAIRTHNYFSLIEAAQDKLSVIRHAMEAAIGKSFEDKKDGGVA